MMSNQPQNVDARARASSVVDANLGSSSEDGEDSDVNYGPDGRGATNVDKAKKLLFKGRTGFVEDIGTLCNILLKRPGILQHPSLQNLRELISHIISHQQDYNVCIDPDAVQLPSESSNVPALTPGFVKYISENVVTSSNSNIPKPVLKVFEKSAETKKLHVGGKECLTTVTTLSTVDGGGLPLTVKVATQLQSCIGTVKPGSVIEAIKWAAIPHNENQRGGRDIGVVLVLCNYRHLGRLALTDGDINAWDREVEVTTVPESADLNNEARDFEAQDSANNEEESGSDNEARDTANYEEENAAECTDENRICSRYGKAFLECICTVSPPEDLILAEIAAESHYVTVPVEEVTESWKRHLIYYWYATNIYGISGKHNRIRLPGCLKARVRAMHPSDTITGHKDAPHSSEEDDGPSRRTTKKIGKKRKRKQ